MIEDPFKVIAADILYQRNEQLKRDLIKKAHEADRAKLARLQEKEKCPSIQQNANRLN